MSTSIVLEPEQKFELDHRRLLLLRPGQGQALWSTAGQNSSCHYWPSLSGKGDGEAAGLFGESLPDRDAVSSVGA